jgi:hypothetical protein
VAPFNSELLHLFEEFFLLYLDFPKNFPAERARQIAPGVIWNRRGTASG